tara:strand:- start:61 stop:504 length:444 start_codon:yes stop_codon:yes gene_type:complete
MTQYDNNLSIYKDLVEEINCFFEDTTENKINISNFFTEDFIFYSFPAGNRKGIETLKVDYINSFNQMKKNNINLQIVHSIYLPGIDEFSHNLDGSVRSYYGADIFIDTNIIDFSAYQTINFENEKISAIWEWADYGGVKNLINKIYE